MKTIKSCWRAFVSSLGLGIAATLITCDVFADDPPVLTISSLSSNQFLITVTNGVSTNYTLYWTPVLADANYPWQVRSNGILGQTNFAVDGGLWQNGFFRVATAGAGGADQDGDGVPDWMDAQPGNPGVGILTVRINAPADGSVVQ